jgi:predicted HTH transcriptional regulator
VSLLDLLKRNEGKTIEFKRDLSSPDGVLKSLVAFANTAGGTVVVGVDDGTKRVRGVPDILEAEERIANLVTDSIHPRLVPEIEVVPWRNVNVLTIHVYPSNTRPHFLERLGPDNGVFIRVGSTPASAPARSIIPRWAAHLGGMTSTAV